MKPLIYPLLHETLLILRSANLGKPAELSPPRPLEKEYKGFNCDLIEQHLQIKCAMSVAATLTSIEGSCPNPGIGSWTVFIIWEEKNIIRSQI